MISSGEIKKSEINNDNIILTCVNGLIKIETISQNIIRFKGTSGERFTDKPLFVIEDQFKTPLAIEKSNVSETDEFIEIITEKIKVKIDKSFSKISIRDYYDNIILDDFDSAFSFEGEEIKFTKKKSDDVYYYGLGERFGSLEASGQKKTLYNLDCMMYNKTDQLYLSIPFILAKSITYNNSNEDTKEAVNNDKNSNFSYGLYSNNTYKTIVDFNSDELFSIKSTSGEMDYYFIYGKTPKEIIKAYTALTGRMSMPPIWSLGYHQSRWGYKDFDKIKQVAKTFRDRDIPCDAIHLDIQYMDSYKVFTWDKKHYLHPTAYLNSLKKEDNINIVTIVDPGVKKDTNYDIFNEGLKKELFCKKKNGDLFPGVVWPGNVVYPDFFKEETRDWWATLVSSLLRQGVKGIWNDMNEPVLRIKGKSNIDDPDMYHSYNNETYKHKELRNLYAYFMAKATHLGMSKEIPNKRGFILTRSGFAGIQKYSAVWTGDNNSNWEHLKMTIPMLLNLGLSGVSFCGADVGGFASGSKFLLLKLMKKLGPSPELYARWVELGSLTPFFRTHTIFKSKDQEPWSFGEEVEQISKKYIKLRYQLLPYLYNCFYESHSSGVPVMRSLFLNYPNDKKSYLIEDEFFVGDDILVAPIVEKGGLSRQVYLPEGDWINYHNGGIYKGSKDITIEAPLDILPVFIRKGSIIPKYEDLLQSTSDIKKSILLVDIYVDEKPNSFSLYEDDGLSNDYKKGLFSKTDFKYSIKNNNVIEFSISRVGEFLPNYKVIKLTFKNVNFSPKKISINNNNAFDTNDSDKNKEIVKVTENINYKTSTGMCWFLEKSSIPKYSPADVTVIVPNKKIIDVNFTIFG